MSSTSSSRFCCRALPAFRDLLEHVPQNLVVNDRRLADRAFLRERTGTQLNATMHDAHYAILRLAHLHALSAQRVRRARGLHQIEHTLVVQGEVVGQAALFLSLKHLVQLLIARSGRWASCAL